MLVQLLVDLLVLVLRLHLYHLSWPNRSICADIEVNQANMILGTDGERRCVYFVTAPAYRKPSRRWELMNDGTCEESEEI